MKNVVGLELMTEEGASQDRCCEAGIQMGRLDLMQACLAPDGDEVIELEVNDMGECIERVIQHLRF